MNTTRDCSVSGTRCSSGSRNPQWGDSVTQSSDKCSTAASVAQFSNSATTAQCSNAAAITKGVNNTSVTLCRPQTIGETSWCNSEKSLNERDFLEDADYHWLGGYGSTEGLSHGKMPQSTEMWAEGCSSSSEGPAYAEQMSYYVDATVAEVDIDHYYRGDIGRILELPDSHYQDLQEQSSSLLFSSNKELEMSTNLTIDSLDSSMLESDKIAQSCSTNPHNYTIAFSGSINGSHPAPNRMSRDGGRTDSRFSQYESVVAGRHESPMPGSFQKAPVDTVTTPPRVSFKDMCISPYSPQPSQHSLTKKPFQAWGDSSGKNQQHSESAFEYKPLICDQDSRESNFLRDVRASPTQPSPTKTEASQLSSAHSPELSGSLLSRFLNNRLSQTSCGHKTGQADQACYQSGRAMGYSNQAQCSRVEQTSCEQMTAYSDSSDCPMKSVSENEQYCSITRDKTACPTEDRHFSGLVRFRRRKPRTLSMIDDTKVDFKADEMKRYSMPLVDNCMQTSIEVSTPEPVKTKVVYLLYPQYSLPNLRFLAESPADGLVNLCPTTLDLPNVRRFTSAPASRRPLSCNDIETIRRQNLSRIGDWCSLRLLLPPEALGILKELGVAETDDATSTIKTGTSARKSIAGVIGKPTSSADDPKLKVKRADRNTNRPPRAVATLSPDVFRQPLLGWIQQHQQVSGTVQPSRIPKTIMRARPPLGPRPSSIPKRNSTH